MNNRYDRPYPPFEMDLNTVRMDTTLVSLDTSITNPNGDDQGIDYDFKRKDFRTTDEVESVSDDAEVIDSTFPAANSHENRLRVFGVDANSVVSAAPIFTGAWAAGTTGIADRASILAYSGGTVGDTIQTQIAARHDEGVFTDLEALQELTLQSTTASAILGGLINLGRIPANSPQGPYVVADGSLDHNFTIFSAIGADIEYQLNSTTGAWTQLIASATTTGIILAAVLTTSDQIFFRHADSGGSPDYTVMLVEEATTDVAYAIIDTTAVFNSLRGWWSMNESSAGSSQVDRVSRFGTRPPDFDDSNGFVESIAGQTNYGLAARPRNNSSTQEWLEVTDANMADLQFVAGGDWTVLFWVRVLAFDALGTTGADFQHIIGKVDYDSGSPFTNRSWYFFADASGSNRLIFVAIGTSGDIVDSSSKTSGLVDDTWYHCALVYDRSGDMTLYVDAVAQTGEPIASDLQTSSEPLSIGGAYKTGAVTTSNSLDDGRIQDLRVYHRVLSGTEITNIHGLGQPL